MNPFDPSTDPVDSRWRAHLAALPECEPPEALWQRLRAAQQQARGTPQRARWPWLASAAALALAVLLGALLRPMPEPAIPDAAMTAHEVETPASVTTTVTDPASRASLLRIDAALTRAYERNAGDAELDALWQARKGMLDSLASNASAQLLQL